MGRRARVIVMGLSLATIGLGCRGLLGIDDRNVITPDGGETEVGDEPAAGDEAEAPSSGFCMALSPPPVFCADFDEGPVAKGWENEDKNPDPGEFGGGHIARDTTTPP